MKRLLVILLVLAGLGVAAPAVSAKHAAPAGKASITSANCSASVGSIVRTTNQGYQIMKFAANIYNCIQVEAIEWRWSGSGLPDCSTNPCVFHQAYLHDCQCDVNLTNPGSGVNTQTYSQTCWYSGTHSLYAQFYFRIKNSATHT